VRFEREQYTWKSDSSQLLKRGALRWGSNLFHTGILALRFTHLFGSGFLNFSPQTLQNLFIYSAIIVAVLWFVSLAGEERRARTAVAAEPAPESSSLRHDLGLAWNNRQTRLFF